MNFYLLKIEIVELFANYSLKEIKSQSSIAKSLFFGDVSFNGATNPKIVQTENQSIN